jgi:epoxyqueuosine reductase
MIALDLREIKTRAVQRARELGAGDVRVVEAIDDVETRERMRASFARGDFSTWSYDDEHARRSADPSHVLAGARSVICIAVPYGGDASAPPPLHGRVSNYAWSGDYHHEMRALLRDVAEAIDDAAGAPVTAIACDTKPLAERAFAARAGLGWIGKHTNLISPSLGSFVFLGEIVTTLALEADAPLRKSCGACTRCIDVCPTGALRGDYTIDATRCIADLTQRTDPIPRSLRPLIGTWIWGCDLCQLACPPTQQKSRGGSPEDGAVDLIELLQLRSGTFKRRYAKSAMGWRGAAVLRRNAAIALGNALDRSAAGALAGALEADPHPMVRGAAAWALGRIDSPAARAALQRRMALEEETTVREEIAVALACRS